MHTILYSRCIAHVQNCNPKMDLKQCTPGLGIKIWQFKTRVCALGQNKPNYKCMSTLRQIQLEHTHTQSEIATMIFD